MSDMGLGLSGVLALRSRILEKSQSLQPVKPAEQPGGEKGPDFTETVNQALKAVNQVQAESSQQAAQWERGETHDIASVMLSRQKASIAFEATLQARNKLLSAYRDIMNMPV